jgi:capsid protein
MAARMGRAVRALSGDGVGYDAVKDGHRRKAPSINVKSEDGQLTSDQRKRLISGGRDLRRNFPDAAWAIRKHLDFVSTFTFQARTNDKGLDAEMEVLLAEYSRSYRCDLAARHPLRRMIRIAEACRAVDGDIFLLKLADGRMQGIEGDRVQTASDLPTGYKPEDFTHGILTAKGGRSLEYCVCRRAERGLNLQFDRMFPARWIIPHGFYDRFDQVRGVTPLSTALNSFRDLYEGRGYALAKAKIAQLFGLSIYREASDQLGVPTQRDEDGDDVAESPGYEINFDKGPVVLDLDPGDRAEFLENKTPSLEFQSFDKIIVASALKSFDIPLSFYDESHTNFFGSKGALQQYLFSANIKRADVVELLDHWTNWRLGMAVAQGELVLPASIAWQDLNWQWVPAGLPWWKPLEEVKAYVEAIGAGLTSTPRACLERGDDAYEIAAEEAKYQAMRAELIRAVKAAGGSMGGGASDTEPDPTIDPNTGEPFNGK